MRRLSRHVLTVLVLGSLLAAGCQKLNKEMDVDVDSGEWQSRTIDGFQSDKQITVTATSDTAPIEVLIVAGGPPDEKTLGSSNPGKDALAFSKLTKEVNLTASVPAKKEFTISIFAGKKSKVHLKVVSN